MRYLARYILVGIIGSVIMSFLRHDVFDHVLSRTPSFPSFHLPAFGESVTAAVSGKGSDPYHYAPAENIERLDWEALDKAVGHLDIAMYAFTDHILADAVVSAARRGVKVRIYRDGQQFDDEKGRDLYVARALASSRNISVRVKGGRELMHLKEWSDGSQIREGSSNWSVSGEKRQDNSVSLRNDKDAANAFEAKFEHMWERADNLQIQ